MHSTPAMSPSLLGLFHEMQALMGLLPPVGAAGFGAGLPVRAADPGRPAHLVAQDDEAAIEAGFDNMPV